MIAPFEEWLSSEAGIRSPDDSSLLKNGFRAKQRSSPQMKSPKIAKRNAWDIVSCLLDGFKNDNKDEP